MTKGELKAREYRARAEDALAAAEAASLAHVQERQRQAAAVWTGMAEAEERRVQEAVAKAPRPC